MRLIVRVKNEASKLEHIAEKQINQGLSTRTQINPLQQIDDNKFQLSYLVTHNTKVLRSTFLPKTYQIDELITYVSKLISIGQEFLVLRIFNKYYESQKQKQLSPLKGKQSKLKAENKKVLEENNYGGLNFCQQTIKKVKLVKGFSLKTYNIDLEAQKQNQQNTKAKQVNAQNMKTLQVEAEILPAYYRSDHYRKILTDNRNSQLEQINARLTFIHGNVKDKYNVGNAIQEQDEDQDQGAVNKKFEKIKFVDLQSYKVQDINQRKAIYDPNISSYRGQLLRIRKPPLKDHKYYYQIDPYEGFFKQFQSKQKYPKSAQQIFSLNFLSLEDVQKLGPKDISWYMKKDLHYFTIQFNGKNKKQKYKFGCNFEDTVYRWIQALKNTLENWKQIKKRPSMLLDLVRNDKVMLDMKQLSGNFSPKKTPNKYIQAFQNTFQKNQIEQQQQEQIQSPPKLLSAKSNQEMNPKLFRQNLSGQLGSSLSQSHDLKKSQTKTSATTVPQNQESTRRQVQNQVSTPLKRGDSINIDIDKLIQKKQQQKQSLKLKNFKFVKQLGEGSFGQVFLASCNKNNQLYALKVFKKKKLVMNKQIKFAISQISILKQISHPFVISLHFTFQTPNFIYLGLDYCQGKDLSHHLIEEVNFPEIECQFYAAQLVLALEYLHSLDIIYRDLKPENVLLDGDGHLKIIDFGLSKQAENNVAKSFCGSPAYISPEMLKKNGVGKQCDFFSLGAVIYEMLVGQPPFYSEDIKQLYDNIANAKLKFPKIVSQRARSLLQGLLRKNPKTRLGSKGIDQIKNHQFFKGLDWKKMIKKQIKAPRRITIDLARQKDEDIDQSETQLLKIIHEDFDYTESNIKVNRFKNFSFVRQGQFQ